MKWRGKIPEIKKGGNGQLCKPSQLSWLSVAGHSLVDQGNMSAADISSAFGVCTPGRASNGGDMLGPGFTTTSVNPATSVSGPIPGTRINKRAKYTQQL